MKKKNSAKKRLVAAVAMLALSSASLFGSTYAWFTMNKTVTVNGMEVKTTVSSNLLVSADSSVSSTAKNADDTFKTDETQTVKAWLEPVSSYNAAANNYWYTLDALGNGAKVSTANYLDYDTVGLVTSGMTDTTQTTYANNFSEDYGVTKTQASGYNSGTIVNAGVTLTDSAVGYVDYVFQLKATNSTDATESIYLTELTLTYAGATDPDKAFRAAIFMEPWSGSAFSNAGGTTLKAIYSPSGATYQDTTDGGKAASGASATTAVSSLNTSQTTTAFATVDANSTTYFKCVVRLWIEGEDTTCTSDTFAALDNTWGLNLRWDLGTLSSGTVNGNTPVTNLTMATTPASPEP